MKNGSSGCAFLFVALTLIPGIDATQAAGPGPRDHASADEVTTRLIDQLGAASYEARTVATRQLLAMGPRATAALRAAAQGDDFETALRASQLLRVFDELFFAGVIIELEASETKIRWTDPITLAVRLHNPTPYVAKVPFELATTEGHVVPAHIRQVTASLDLADYLKVVGPAGQPVALRVDDITEDERLRAAVDARVEHQPTSDLPPGATVVHPVPEFNRGWARYRLLRAGAYQIQLVYQPQWTDEDLIRAGVGSAKSNVVRITVTEPAPPNVREARTPASLHLERSSEHAIAHLTNLFDLPVYINLNLATAEPPPFARLRWFLTCERVRSEVIPDASPGRAAGPFLRDRLKEVQPGDTIELGRLPMAALQAPNHDPGTCEISVSYSNVAGRAWQRTQAAHQLGNANVPAALRSPLPHRMLTTTLNSPPLTLGTSE